MRAAAAAALALALVVRAPAAPLLPERLSETGLYRPGSVSVDPQNRAFAPQYPLWTDGAVKSRWVRLPPGARIDVRDVDRWVFPVGTRFWKEFAFGGRKVETRMLWQAAAGAWVYASYVWNEAQTEARLAPPEGVPGAIELAPGKRHAIPSRQDCLACHENGAAPVLGFTALQLSVDRDPHAPHAEMLRPGMITLETLVAEQRLDPPSPALALRPPRIPGDARARAALGYLTANCGHCHHEDGTTATARFPLRVPAYASAAEVEAIVQALRARTTRWDLPHAAPGTTRVVSAGAPDLSALIVRMRSRRPSTQMPPLGSVVPDREALALLEGWIEGLPRPGAGDHASQTPQSVPPRPIADSEIYPGTVSR